VIRFLVLYGRMLRYRVAAMLWLFLLLGAAAHGGLAGFSWDYLWVSLSLASSYVAATSLNDVADRDIDRVNHPRDKGRPLVTGEATEHDLHALHVAAAVLALAAGAAAGAAALGLASLSLSISLAYSLPPLELSHRTYFVAPVLGVAYVLIPFSLGLVAAGGSFRASDAVLCAGLVSLFVARINLKDFRDRAGDARYGKPTVLLRFGKDVTCLVSLVALALADLLLLAALRPSLVLVLVLQLFVAAVVSMLYVLWRTEDAHGEQAAIGIGARMGNGLLLALLGWLVLTAHGASAQDRLGFLVSLTALFGLSFYALATRPDQAVIGYKG